MPRRSMTVEEAVREISEALGAAYDAPQDRLTAFLAVSRAIAPTQGPAAWAFEEEALRVGKEHGLCGRCAERPIEIDGTLLCPTCDWRLMALHKAEKAGKRGVA